MKIDPKHAESDPRYARAVEAGQKRLPKMRKEMSQGEYKDYERKVASNPHNVMGLPAFHPGLEIRSGMAGVKPARECAEDGGCATARDGYICPRCHKQVEE